MTDSIFTGEFFVPGHAPRRLEQDHLARYDFAKRFVAGKRVLDIACGSGYGTRALLESGALSVDGVDISPEAIQYASDHFSRAGVNYSCASIYTFQSFRPYDVIVSFETIEHVKDYRHALDNLYRLLAVGGTLLISSPNRFITSPLAVSLDDKPANPYHVMEFVLEEFMAALTAAGFRVSLSGVYGQRFQPKIKSIFLRKLYRRLFRPHVNSCPVVKPVGSAAPRYFVLVADKG